jgi:hypothetical protein
MLKRCIKMRCSEEEVMRMIRMSNYFSGTLKRMRPSGRWCMAISRPTVRSGREDLRVFEEVSRR